MTSTVDIYGMSMWSGGFDAALDALERVVDSGANGVRVVVTPNVDHLVRLQKDPGLLAEYRGADFIFPDGFPVVASSRFLGQRIQERVTGADLFPALCSLVASRRGRVFILGGPPGRESFVKDRLEAKYPGLEVRAYSPPYGFTAGSREGRVAAEKINEFRPAVVFACLGMPRQEHWAFMYRDTLDTRLVLCVGAALEFDLGLRKRAPAWVRSLRLEWFWRLCSDPVRLWRRYLVDDVAFIGIFLREFRSRRARA